LLLSCHDAVAVLRRVKDAQHDDARCFKLVIDDMPPAGDETERRAVFMERNPCFRRVTQSPKPLIYVSQVAGGGARTSFNAKVCGEGLNVGARFL
jgi:hypothetical protein